VFFDLLIRGGRVIDPALGVDGRRDVGISAGRVAAVEATLAGSAARREIDAAGRIVTPGLIDVHTHVFRGADLYGVDVDSLARRSGVTTWVDAGSAGAFRIPALHEFIAEPAEARVLALINISYLGLAGLNYDEYCNPAACNLEVLERVVAAQRNFVVGIKVRMGRDGFCNPDLGPLRLAIEAGQRTDLPVMCHISGTPPSIGEVVDLLRPGDIVTHSYTGAGQRLVDQDGRLDDHVRAARERGVLFDIGHGAGSFSFESAEALAAAEFWPDTISTDLHQLSLPGRNLVADQAIVAEVRGDGAPELTMLTVMAKLLSLGMPLVAVIDASTARPAAAIRRPDLGSLRPGSVADVAILELTDRPLELTDIHGARRSARSWFSSAETIVAGRLMSPRELPPPPPWIRLIDHESLAS
jgi:dihydroorotase